MKKILVITPFFYPHLGGSQQYMEGLYVFLKKKHPQLQIDVLCYNTDKTKPRELYRGLRLYRIPAWNVLPGQFALPKLFPLLKFLSEHKDYDLIHTSTRFFDSSWWAPLYAKLTGTKIVLTDHCAYHPVSGNKIVDMVVGIVEATIVRLSLHFYDDVFSENKKTANFLKDNFGIKSEVAYPGIFGNSVLGQKPKNKRVKVVYAGRLIKTKGIKDLITIAKKIKEADFIFAGEGPLIKELKSEAKKLDNVKILGGIPQKEVMELFKTSDIFAYPSMHSEGLPLAIVEAGQSGMAVVATESGAINEVIKNNKTGILVKRKDFDAFNRALKKLVEDRILREKLGNNLQKFIFDNFSWDKASKLVLQNLPEPRRV